ncbi:MAG: hypothetical protein HWD59_15220 [Coxiellaceae bacterium]|nr:MAG: hypothetical protein HWD59_15220 [Coxiellaceae bacterium]
MTYEGKKIDAYEYRAKQILISAAPKRFKYEEFNLLENQLELVKNNQYGMK